MKRDQSIEKRLTGSFIKVIIIVTLAAVVGCVALLYTSGKYQYALQNYGFSQGDIGKAMTVFADSRSAARAIIGYTDSKVIDDAVNAHDSDKKSFLSYMEAIKGTLTSPPEEEAYAAAEEALTSYWNVEEKILEIGNTTDAEQSAKAQVMAAEELDPLYETVYQQLAALMDLNVSTGDSLDNSLGRVRTALILVIIAVVAAAAVISLKIAKNIAGGIAKPINELSARLDSFAEGNLSDPFPEVKVEDEVGAMVKTASSMAENLNMLIKDLNYCLDELAKGNFAVKSHDRNRYKGQFSAILDALVMLAHTMSGTLSMINDSSAQVALGSNQLAEGAQALAEGATDQAASVEELQATIADIGEIIDQNADKVKGAYEKTKEISCEADNSKEEMDTMVESMRRINDTSIQIGNIIADIEDIASQTNLLALNASIEAARAGEAGKGFAVVADQIGKLAEESAKSAVNTKELIEKALSEIRQGNQITERTQTALQNVINGIIQFAKVSQELAESSQAEDDAIRQIENGVDQISKVVQNNSAAAEETSATSEELSAQASTLKDLVGQFILSNS